MSLLPPGRQTGLEAVLADLAHALADLGRARPEAVRAPLALWSLRTPGHPDAALPSSLQAFTHHSAAALAARLALLSRSGAKDAAVPCPLALTWRRALASPLRALFAPGLLDWWLPLVAGSAAVPARRVEQAAQAAGEGLARLPAADPLEGLPAFSAGDPRKAAGEFFTPPALTGFCLDRVGWPLPGQGPGLLDPACGAGAFLTAALERWLEDTDRRPDRGRGRAARWAERLEDLARQPVLAGLDVQPLACLVTACRLALRLTPQLHDVVREFPSFFLPRPAVFCSDALLAPAAGPSAAPLALEVPWGPAGPRVLAAALPDPGPSLRAWLAALECPGTTLPPAPGALLRGAVASLLRDELAAAALKARARFAAVVGNPPYVRAGRLSRSSAAAYRRHWQAARGAFDLSVPFLERAAHWLAPGGRAALVVSNKPFVSDYGRELRRLLGRGRLLEELLDLGPLRAFPGTAVRGATVVLRRASAGEGPRHRPVLGLLRRDDPSLLRAAGRALDRARQGKPPEEDPEAPFAARTLDDPRALATGAPLPLGTTPARERLLQRLEERARPLGTLGELRGGLMGFDYPACRPHLAEGRLGRTGWVPAATPGNVRPFRFDPGAACRLFGRLWHGPCLPVDAPLPPGALRLAGRSKLILRGVARRLTAAWDPAGAALLVAVWGLVPAGCNPFFLLGLLNSGVLDFWARCRGHGARIPRGSWRFPLGLCRRIPIRLPSLPLHPGLRRQVLAHARRLAGEAMAGEALVQEGPRLFAGGRLVAAIEEGAAGAAQACRAARCLADQLLARSVAAAAVELAQGTPSPARAAALRRSLDRQVCSLYGLSGADGELIGDTLARLDGGLEG